jgi:hypothetical protein
MTWGCIVWKRYVAFSGWALALSCGLQLVNFSYFSSDFHFYDSLLSCCVVKFCCAMTRLHSPERIQLHFLGELLHLCALSFFNAMTWGCIVWKGYVAFSRWALPHLCGFHLVNFSYFSSEELLTFHFYDSFKLLRCSFVGSHAVVWCRSSDEILRSISFQFASSICWVYNCAFSTDFP